MKKLWILLVVLMFLVPLAASADEAAPAVPSAKEGGPPLSSVGGVGIPSLKQISIDGLRSRQFSSTLAIESQLGTSAGESAYSQYYGAPFYNTYMASYQSDGLRVYTRVDVPPTPMPAAGYPVIIYSHGWVGAAGAQPTDSTTKPTPTMAICSTPGPRRATLS